MLSVIGQERKIEEIYTETGIWGQRIKSPALSIPSLKAFILIRFLGWEDPLEKEMATHSSILAWRIPWTEEPDRLQSMGLQESDTTEQLNHHHTYKQRAALCGFI